MAPPIKKIGIFAVILICLFLVNRLIVMKLFNDTLRARIIRFQLTCFIISFMALINCFTWRNLSTLFDPACHPENMGSNGWSLAIDIDEIRNWRRLTVNGLIWRVVLAVIQISSLLPYMTFSFLITTDPYWISFWLFLCLGFVIQLFCGLVVMKVFTFTWNFLNKHHRTSAANTKVHQSIVVLYALFIASVGFYNILQPPLIKEVSVPLKNLPQELDKLTITFVSDIHLGPTIGKKRLEQVVHMINYLNSDVVIIGGDLVDGTVNQLNDAVESLSWINSKYGVYFVTGNHEYYTADVDRWLGKLETLGVTPLHNTHTVVSPDNGEAGVCLAGVDDPTADSYRYKDHTVDLDKALKPCNKDYPVILVAHQPATAKVALNTDYRLDLILSGHTHGGQMFPVVIGAYLFNPFYAGLYQRPGGTQVYVSKGTLYWGFPIRFLANHEITKITLSPAM